jgi:hypothetical protein
MEDWNPEVIKEGALLPHSLSLADSYMKDGIDGLHGEVFLDFNDKKVDHFLIRLQ